MRTSEARRSAWQVFLVGFLLNLAWESAHSPLYTCYNGFIAHFPLVFRASLGDAAYIIAVYLVFSWLKKDAGWFRKIQAVDIFALLAVGSAVAYGIERFALATERWAYTGAMPLVPWLAIGWTPFVQLSLTSVAAFAVLKLIKNKK